MSVKDQIRVDQNFQETPTGRLFFDSHSAKLTDLSGVRLLRCGVDTVRQLYRGLRRLVGPSAANRTIGRHGQRTSAGYQSWSSCGSISTASRSPMAFDVWRSCGRVPRRWAIR